MIKTEVYSQLHACHSFRFGLDNKDSTTYVLQERDQDRLRIGRSSMSAVDTWRILCLPLGTVVSPGGRGFHQEEVTDSVRYSYFTPQFPWNLSCPPLLSGTRLALMGSFCGIISTYLDSRGEESTNTKNCRDRSRKEFRKITESPNKAGNSKYAQVSNNAPTRGCAEYYNTLPEVFT